MNASDRNGHRKPWLLFWRRASAGLAAIFRYLLPTFLRARLPLGDFKRIARNPERIVDYLFG
jgi:hypothetical protein